MKNFDFVLILKSYRDFFKSLSLKNRLYVCNLLLGGVIGSILELLVIVLVTPLISSLTGESINNTYITSILNIFDNVFRFLNLATPSISISLLFIVIVKNFYWIFYTKLIYNFSYGFEVKLSQKIFESFVTSDYLKHVNKKTSDFIADATFEARKINLNFISPTFIIFSELFVLMIIVYFLVLISSIYSIYSVVVIGLIMFVFHKVSGKKIKNYSNIRVEYENKRIDFIKHSFDSFKEIKLRAIENEYLKHFDYLNKVITDSESRFSLIQQIPRYIYEMLLYTLIIGIVLYSKIFFSETSVILGLGLFIVSLIRIVPSITKITSNYQSLLYSLASIKRFDITDINRKDIPKSSVLKRDFKKLKIKKLSFSYPNENKRVLDQIDFSFEKGEFIGIHGESGSGKSTLMHILSGLINSFEGDLLINSVKGIDLKTLVSYCHQDIIILSGTLAENISFNLNKDPDFDKIDTVIKQVDLQSLTNDLEHGIHAQISENGANLSGGQKQRIGLARALYRESKILLLDEFTSSLDKKTEQNILKSLLKLKNQNISMIMVSHKTEPLEICDRIYELQNGQFSDK